MSRFNSLRAPLASGLWPLASGLWPLASGLWPLASGLWPLASGLWPLASGLWPLASGLWPLASGLWPLASGLWPLASGLWPLASGLWPLASGLWPLASGLWPLASGLWPLASGLWPLASGLWPLALAPKTQRRKTCFEVGNFVLVHARNSHSPNSPESPSSSHLAPLVLVVGCVLAFLVVVFGPTLWVRGLDMAPPARAALEMQGRLSLVGALLCLVLAWCGVELSRSFGALSRAVEQGAATQAASERAAFFGFQASETARYASAMALLSHESLEVRLGGVYSLERLARESKADHGPIIEVLAAFARARAPWKEGEAAPPRPASDIQALLGVIGRRTAAFDPAQSHIDLHGTALARAYLPFANLSGARLYEANLEGAVLQGADLRGAWLWKARLTEAVLDGTHLEGADLTGASGLTALQLRAAHLDSSTKLPEYLRAELDWKGPSASVEPVVGASVDPSDLKLPSLRSA